MATNNSICAQSLPSHQESASWKTLLGLVSHWRDRARQRRQLAYLDDRALRDIGVDRTTARIEAAKTFWRD